MKNIAAILCLIAASSTCFAYPVCSSSVDLQSANVKNIADYGTAAKYAGEAMSLGGASAVSICQAGGKLVVVSKREILSGPNAGQTVKMAADIFSE